MSDEGERVDAVVGQDSFEDRQVGTLEVRLPLELCGGGAEEEFGDRRVEEVGRDVGPGGGGGEAEEVGEESSGADLKN